MNILPIIGRHKELFVEDVERSKVELFGAVSTSSFLAIGSAGSIGQAVTKETCKRKPRKVLVVDISGNNMVTLVRDFWSACGYTNGSQTFALDIGSRKYQALKC